MELNKFKEALMTKNEKHGGCQLKKTWTTRGKMAAGDRQVIAAIAGKNKVAARIFVTGEVHESYIGEAACRMLSGINDVFYENNAGQEPLFVETNRDTVRMTRFVPHDVWRYFHPDIVMSLCNDEVKRLGVKMDVMEMAEYDFYECMLTKLRTQKKGMIPVVKDRRNKDSIFNAVYMSCLLLFNKPGFMGVSPAAHFSDPVMAEHLKWTEYRELSPAEENKAAELAEQYKKVHLLTNPEINFIIGLYEKNGARAVPANQ
jgi:hypothetical protein